jgi:DNA polymerase III epsilon subunit family exonuclease
MVDPSLLPQRFVVFCLETTGLDPTRHEIIEIGAIKVNRGSVQHEKFETLIKPLKSVPKEITSITGISQDMIDREGEALETAITDFAAFIEDLPLVAFNAEFHVAFLKNSAAQYNIFIGNPVSCALKMAQNAWPGRQSHRLVDLARDGKLSTDRPHRAFDDCMRVVFVYHAAASILGYSGFVVGEQLSEGRKQDSKMATEVGHLQAKYGVRGSVSFSVEVRHRGLHKQRLIRGPDAAVVQAKARLSSPRREERCG